MVSFLLLVALVETLACWRVCCVESLAQLIAQDAAFFATLRPLLNFGLNLLV